MSDFDSTDFDSSSEGDQAITTPSQKSTVSEQGNFDYPEYIQLTPCRVLFQQEEFSYREKQINLIIRDKNASTQENTAERFQQTYTQMLTVDEAVEAPSSEHRNGMPVLLSALEPHKKVETTRSCLKSSTTRGGCVVVLSRLENAEKAVLESNFTPENGEFSLSDCLPTVLICEEGSAVFTFSEPFCVSDFVLMPNEQVAICSDSGYVAIAVLPDFTIRYFEYCPRRLVNVCYITGELLALAIDGSIRRVTELNCEVLGQDRSYLEIGTASGKGFIRTTQGGYLCFDNAEQIRNADFVVSYYLERDAE